MIRNLSFTSDGDFSKSELIRSYNEELGNDLGNLLNRVVSMIQRYRNGSVPTAKTTTAREEDVQRIAAETRQAVADALDAWDIGGALSFLWQLVRRANQYIEQSEPWKLAKQAEQQEQLDTVLYSAAEALRLIALLLAPFLPTTSKRILAQLGKAEGVRSDAWIQDTTWGSDTLTKVVPGNVLFPRIE